MSSAGASVLPLELRPFPGQAAPAGLRFTAAAWAEPGGAGALALCWRLEGDLSAVALPSDAAAPERRDGLWQHSCFEAFIGRRGDPAYWELNLSPCGDWNFYHLDDYRSGLRPEPSLVALPSRCRRSGALLELQVALPLPEPLAAAGEALQLALTAVLEDRQGGCSYWALAHTGAEADFHRRDSFVLTF